MAWPVVLIGLGLLLLLSRLVSLHRLVDLLPPHKTHGGLPIGPSTQQ
jgi:hypothetical protein